MQGHKLGCSRLQGRVNCRESSSKSWSIPQWVAMILVIYGDIRCLSLYLAELYIYDYDMLCIISYVLAEFSWRIIAELQYLQAELEYFTDQKSRHFGMIPPLQQHHHFSDVAATAQLDCHDLWRLMFSHLTPAVTQFIHHQHVNFK